MDVHSGVILTLHFNTLPLFLNLRNPRIIETAVSFIISNPQLSAGIFKGCVDFLNGHHNRELQKESEEKRRITQLQVEYLREMSQLKIAEDNRNFQRELEVSRQNFQQKMVQYECQENRKLQEFIKSVDIAINQQGNRI